MENGEMAEDWKVEFLDQDQEVVVPHTKNDTDDEWVVEFLDDMPYSTEGSTIRCDSAEETTRTFSGGRPSPLMEEEPAASYPYLDHLGASSGSTIGTAGATVQRNINRRRGTRVFLLESSRNRGGRASGRQAGLNGRFNDPVRFGRRNNENLLRRKQKSYF